MKDVLERLNTIVKRVEWLYDHHPDSYVDDVVLLAMYENYFKNVKFSEATIKRSGRYLRNSYPQKYKRPELKEIRDRQHKKAVIKAFSGFN